ncbi:MAG: gephyrin-like molybdotransferase Glp [Pseudolysinimonas sp.]|uniref:molybdopterin molybdotransferase MoeA n=1 Tax=Pseudolysinimonas sp. TaxID=2680009 RepID=UPI003264DDEC
MPRTPVAEHEARVRALLSDLSTRASEVVALADALGRVTASDVVSPIPLPPFRNSQMDGFAVLSSDVVAVPVDLPLVGEIAAAPGMPAPLMAGTVVRIMTGAPVPEGADAVVPVEDTHVSGSTVSIARGRVSGEYVREIGSDLPAGAVVIPAGVRLASRHLGALAASGLTSVEVTSPVRVAVISTGSELVEAGEPLGPGQIPDSNGVALAAAVRAVGAFVIAEGRVTDVAERFRAVLDAAVDAGAELVLTSGGISEGEYEVVRETLEPLGAHVDVLAMQPGGPQATASYRGVPVVCFPGNPVSSQLSFLIFVEPVLRALAGLAPAVRTTGVLDRALTSQPGRRQFLRGVRLPDGRVAPHGGSSSHLVATLAAADVLLVIPEDVTSLDAGAAVEVWDL